jgi:plastocyanin
LRRRRATTLALLALALAGGGCTKPAKPPPAAPSASATAGAAVPAANAGAGKVVGRVPASGTALVVLEPKSAKTFPAQTETPVMDQVGLAFGPELLLVRTGQPVEFRNSDDTLHNVHVSHEETHTPAFNVAIPTGNAFTYTFERDGFYRVGCDIHPAMAASIFSASTPFTALAESDGRFTFTSVPAGAWTVTVYTGGRRLQKDVDVNGGTTEVTLE